MSALSRFEEAVDRLTGGGALDFFAGDLHPTEIAKRLVREIEIERQIGPHGRTVPTLFDVWLSPTDYGRIADRRAALEQELVAYLREAARELGLRLSYHPIVRLAPVAGLARHQILVEARSTGASTRISARGADEVTTRIRTGSREDRWLPEIRLIDPHIPDVVVVDRLPFSLGRSLDSDFSIDDRRVSRHHAVIKQIDGYVCLEDLKSTNETFVNGQAIRQRVLTHGDTISLGGYTITIAFGSRPGASIH